MSEIVKTINIQMEKESAKTRVDEVIDFHMRYSLGANGDTKHARHLIRLESEAIIDGLIERLKNEGISDDEIQAAIDYILTGQ